MLNTYVIEYELADDAPGPLFGHTTYAAPDAKSSVAEFYRDRPDADIRELRRVHVQGD